jgi:hypothetical protein
LALHGFFRNCGYCLWLMGIPIGKKGKYLNNVPVQLDYLFLPFS